MKTPKITKLLPLAMALMMMSPAVFAAAVDNSSSTMTLTVPEFINITKKASSVETANATFDDTYETITIDQMNAEFQVVNNKPGQVIQLSGKTELDATSVDALYGTGANALNLVFTNNTGVKATSGAVTNITGASPSAKDNANAIAFSVTPEITPEANSGATEPTINFNAGIVKYTISNGIYAMKYTIGTTAVANTFSTHDTNGDYKATLTLSKVTP